MYYHSGSEWTCCNANYLKLQNCSLINRLFSVISRHSFGEGCNSSAEKQSVYSTTAAHLYGIKYFYQIQIIFTWLYGFKHSYPMLIIFKQIALTHCWDPNKYYQSGYGSNGNSRVIVYFPEVKSLTTGCSLALYQ